MNIHTFMELLAIDIKAWTVAAKGEFEVAQDPAAPFVALAAGGFRDFGVILSFGGEQPDDAGPQRGMSRLSVDVHVGYGLDLSADPGSWLYIAKAGGPKPLLERMDSLRNRLLTIVFAAERDGDSDSYAEWGGISDVQLPDTTPLRAYRARATWPLRMEADVDDYRYLNGD